MLYTDFESILKLVDEHYRDNMNQMLTFVFDPMKRYHGKDCVEKFVEHIEYEVKQLYVTFSQWPMTQITDALKRGVQHSRKMSHLL